MLSVLDSGQAIADLYNLIQDTGEKVLDDDMCRSVLYLYAKLKFEVDVELFDLAGVADSVMTYPACPEASANDPKDKLFLTMDGNFSQKCKKNLTVYDRDIAIPIIYGMWVKKEAIDSVGLAASSQEALKRESSFKAAGTDKKKNNQYPVTGLFACVCPRHEIVRKLADMSTNERYSFTI